MTKIIPNTQIVKGLKESKIAKSENNDCSVKAIATAFNVEYDKAHKFLSENYNRPNKKGVSSRSWHNINDKFSDENTTVLGKKIKKIEYTEIEVDAKRCVRKSSQWNNGSSYDYKKKLKLYTKKGSKYSQLTVGSFLKKYKEGTYMVSVRAHTFTIKDGIVCEYGIVKKRVPIEKIWEVV